ncbi:MAG: hypothetical protein DWP92_08845 [Armatimonadetes bacterium]|nr:MAG: hypothetical protein DWP92_08845 [Armatimonadota bacterium]
MLVRDAACENTDEIDASFTEKGAYGTVPDFSAGIDCDPHAGVCRDAGSHDPSGPAGCSAGERRRIATAMAAMRTAISTARSFFTNQTYRAPRECGTE